MGQQFSAGARLPRHVYPTSPTLAWKELFAA
jgi:hypothetical protein